MAVLFFIWIFVADMTF